MSRRHGCRPANVHRARDTARPGPARARLRPRRQGAAHTGGLHGPCLRRHDTGGRRGCGLPILRSGGGRSRPRAGRRHRRSRRRCGRLGRRGGSRPRRQQRQRVDVALRVVGAADAQMHVGHVQLDVAGRSYGTHRLTFRNPIALREGDRPEVRQRHRQAVGGPDRRRAPVPRQPAGERDPARSRRRDRRGGRSADVDAGVAAFVVLGAAEVEAAKHRSVGRPAPTPGGSGSNQRDEEHAQRCCHFRQHLSRRK
jgi:hypothetical protein